MGRLHAQLLNKRNQPVAMYIQGRGQVTRPPDPPCLNALWPGQTNSFRSGLSGTLTAPARWCGLETCATGETGAHTRPARRGQNVTGTNCCTSAGETSGRRWPGWPFCPQGLRLLLGRQKRADGGLRQSWERRRKRRWRQRQ